MERDGALRLEDRLIEVGVSVEVQDAVASNQVCFQVAGGLAIHHHVMNVELAIDDRKICGAGTRKIEGGDAAKLQLFKLSELKRAKIKVLGAGSNGKVARSEVVTGGTVYAASVLRQRNVR